MLTYEKVLEIFADYLREDECTEVVSTRHGQVLLMWESVSHAWEEPVPCETPEQLFDTLLTEYKYFYSNRFAES